MDDSIRQFEEYQKEHAKRWFDDPDWSQLRTRIVDLLDDDIQYIVAKTLRNVLKVFPEREDDYAMLAQKFAAMPELTGWDLSGFDFSWLAEPDLINYSGQKLAPMFLGHKYENVYFVKCIFDMSSFTMCEFVHCHFDGAIFNRAIFEECKFKFCSFDLAELQDVRLSDNFYKCSFRQSHIQKCEIESTSIYQCNWRDSTLAKSKSTITRMSEAVLQSMAFSNYQLSLDIRRRNMDPTVKNFQSVFLSHNSQDNEFANRLAGDLSRNGVRVWIDEAEMKVGDSLIKSIQSGIEDMDFLAVILTPESVASPWVEKELNVALTKEIIGKSVAVLPILLRD